MKEEFENEKNQEVKEVAEIENIENNASTEKKVSNKSGKKKSWLIVVGAFLVGLVLLFTFTSYKYLFNPKKITFLTYITKDVENLNGLIENIESNKLLNFITNGVTKSANFDFSLNSKNISGETIIDKEFLALKLNGINEDYLLLENKNLDTLWMKFGLEEAGLPSEINFEDNSISLTNGEKRKIYSFITNCTTNILDNLENEDFILNPEDVLNINDENVNLKSIEVQLSETDLFMLQKEVLTALERDGILDLFIKKINKISTAETLDKKEIKQEIDKYITYLDYAKAYYDLQEQESDYYIVYKIYYNDEGIAGREITEKYTYEGTLYEDVICSFITRLNDYYEVKWFTQEDYSSAYYNIISDKITNEGNKQNHLIKSAVEGFYVEYSEDSEDYEYVPANSEVTYNFALEALDNGVTKLELIDADNVYSFTLNYTDNSADLDFSTVYNEDDLKVKLEVKDSETTKEILLNGGAILINDKSQEELITEFSKVGNKLSEIFAE